MTVIDCSIVGGTAITPSGIGQANIHIASGRIVSVDTLRPPAVRVVDAAGLLILPGFVDTHVHLMDPGDPSREDFPAGTAAAAARGVTTVIEHTHVRPVRTVPELHAKLRHLEGRAHVDFGLAAHVWPERIGELAALWTGGVSFFKAFTCTTHGVPGIEGDQLRTVLTTVAGFGGSCLLHCEDETLTSRAERRLRGTGRQDGTVIAEWRSLDAELTATRSTVSLAEAAGARVTIAHVSSPRVAQVVTAARRRGADIAAEACPQYFLLRETELATEGGALRKFTPPVRLHTDAEEA